MKEAEKKKEKDAKEAARKVEKQNNDYFRKQVNLANKVHSLLSMSFIDRANWINLVCFWIAGA